MTVRDDSSPRGYSATHGWSADAFAVVPGNGMYESFRNEVTSHAERPRPQFIQLPVRRSHFVL
jgi:hypothetical protein